MFYLSDGNISEIVIFEESAASGIVFYAKGVVEIWAVHIAVFAENIADTARDLAADGDAAMPIFHLAAANNEVFSWNTNPTAVFITPRLDGDAVITGVKMAVLDQH